MIQNSWHYPRPLLAKKYLDLFDMGLTSADNAIFAFEQLKSTPEFFRRYIEYYLSNPEQGTELAIENTKNKVFSDNNFQKQFISYLHALNHAI